MAEQIGLSVGSYSKIWTCRHSIWNCRGLLSFSHTRVVRWMLNRMVNWLALCSTFVTTQSALQHLPHSPIHAHIHMLTGEDAIQNADMPTRCNTALMHHPSGAIWGSVYFPRSRGDWMTNHPISGRPLTAYIYVTVHAVKMTYNMYRGGFGCSKFIFDIEQSYETMTQIHNFDTTFHFTVSSHRSLPQLQ